MTTSNQPLSAKQASHSMVNKKTSLGQSNTLTEEETQKILTPFAFSIDETLFGIPLAVPWRRGLALLIDFILIAILSGAPGELLAIVVAITFYRIGSINKHNKAGKLKTFRRALIKFIGAFIIFVVLVDQLPSLFNSAESDDTVVAKENISDNSLGWTEGIAIGALSTSTYHHINNSSCKDITCWKSELLPFVEQLPTLTNNEKTSKTLIETMVATIDEKQKLSKKEQKALEAYFISELDEHRITLNFNVAKNITEQEIAPVAKTENSKPQADKDTAVYKGVEWMKGLIEDLGLGFGWAAFYFTVLTSMWHGQTPGKKLLNIRVIQLDGTRLSMWDSFGRYGGYGAGLATGLLGFLQIYWDPNRQAIHDKISATIVIDVNKFEKMKTQINGVNDV